MENLDRRAFFQAVAVAGLATEAGAQQPATTGSPVDVTRKLARYIVDSKAADLPASVRKEAARTLLNWVGCAVGGSRHETLDIAIGALAPFAGPGQATVLGRSEKLDVMNASLMNGISSHVFDYDDTHLKTVIHPGGPVASAILALAEYRPVTGREFLHALILGIEVACRIGNAVYPQHYDIGWHITGTCGVFGAAAAAGKILGLDEQKMLWALGIAATQPVGLKEMFGTMTKSFHPGRAAQNGLTAAFLAAKGFTSSNQVIEARAGWANTLSTKRDYSQITEGLGQTYEISLNTYKPFACGIVLHPTIDACIQLRNQRGLKADQIAKIELRVHRLVPDLTGNKNPQTGLEGKFSVYYAAAVAIVEGAGGEKQFSDRLVRDPAIVSLRDRVSLTVDPAIHEDQVRVIVTLKDDRTEEKFIEHAIGSIDNPMSDAALATKFLDLADGILPRAKADRLMNLCSQVETLGSAADIAKAAAA